MRYVTFAVLSCLAACSPANKGGGSSSGTGVKKIAFSNNYAGNSWRQAMLKSYADVAKKATADGVIAAADAFTTPDRSVPSQAAQIQNLILQGYNAIIINAGSPTSLNGAVKQACDAGIKVVSFDGLVTEPCAYRVVVDYEALGAEQVAQLAKLRPGGGAVVEIRGVPGTSIDASIHAGVVKGLKAHPNLKIVASVEGDWDQTTTQKAVATVLPSLAPIVGVLDQGGGGYGAAEAFTAADRPLPTIILGNRQDELAWWKEQKAKSGYRTWSASIPPGISTLAFWVAQQLLTGRKDIPHNIVVPYLAFSQDNFEAALTKVPVGGVANRDYSQAEAISAIRSNAR
jgi:ribose transport system substrate-binding protein